MMWVKAIPVWWGWHFDVWPSSRFPYIQVSHSSEERMNPNQKMSAADALTRAVTQLLVHQPFFGQLAMRLLRVEAPWIETMATDGVHMFYNVGYVESCSPEEVIGAVAHEVMHCVLQHFLRR